MNPLEEKIMVWSQQEFNVKMQNKDSLKNGEQIKRFYDSIQCRNQLKSIEKEIEDIEHQIRNIRTTLLSEELNRKCIKMSENFNENRIFVSTFILNAIENICAKNKHCTQLKSNLKSINETIASYENLCTYEEFGSKTADSSDETPIVNNNIVLNQVFDQINQLMTRIDAILYDLNHLEVSKPIKISIDSESVLKCLVEKSPKIEIKPIGKGKDNKSATITSKLVSAQTLVSKYQTTRSEKLSKNKEKLEKVIKSCDEFIQQIV